MRAYLFPPALFTSPMGGDAAGSHGEPRGYAPKPPVLGQNVNLDFSICSNKNRGVGVMPQTNVRICVYVCVCMRIHVYINACACANFTPRLFKLYFKEVKTMCMNKDIRICSECGRAMRAGYCIHDGEEYYCSDECLYSNYSEQEYLALYDSGFGDSYYTEWEEE